MDAAELAPLGVESIMAGIRATLEAYRVHFDSWFLERSLHEGEPNAVERTLALLEEQGHTYRSEGALWLRTSQFGDDKDRVLVRSSGETTYFANDVAYHEDKLERGYDRMINLLGSDHHGYIARMKASMSALGIDPDRLEIPILQFVHIVEGARRASMSKRRGDFVTLDDLIAEIGVDATRFYMLSRSHDSTVDLDVELAKSQEKDNPVYYVQYHHARCASILRQVDDRRRGDWSGLRAARERARADQEAAGVPGRGRRGGRAARPAQDLRLRARAVAGVRGVLPRLPGARRRLRRAALAAARPGPRDQGGHRPVAGAAGGRGAGLDVITRS